MPKCHFTTKYYDYEIGKKVDFYCDDEDPLASGFCIFHDKGYLHHYLSSFREEHKRKVLERLKRKVNHAISYSESLLCIGFQLPDFSLSDLSIIKEFTKPVYFFESQFFGKVDFSETKFQGEADFYRANFQGEADFYRANFQISAHFSYANFQGEVSFGGANFQGKAFTQP